MTPGLKSHRILLAICAATTLVFALLTWFPPDVISRVENLLRDFLVRQGRPARPNAQVVFLAIDKTSTDFKSGVSPISDEQIEASPALQKLGSGWPIVRDFYPLLIERLVKAGAKVVAFDLLFVAPREGDDALRAALDRYRDRVVIGINFSSDPHARGGGAQNLQIPPESLISRATGPADSRLGYVNFWPDHDLVIRRAHYRITQEELDGFVPGPESLVFESLAARALHTAGLSNRIPPGREPRSMRLARPYDQDPKFGFTPYSRWEIFMDDMWNRAPYNGGELFRDKIVLVGPFGDWSKDFVGSAYGPDALPGPVMHLNALNAALNNDYLRETPRPVRLLLVLLAGVAALGLSLGIHAPLTRFLLLLGGMAGYLVASLLVYNAGAYLLIFTPVMTFGTSGFTWLVWEQVLDRLERQRMRHMVERYVSKDVVKEILDNPESFLHTMKGRRRPVAILFTDIRGFTTLTEAADSEQLVAQLNEYFEAMVALIFENKGSLDKFIGDAIMAVWGNVLSEGPAEDARRAVTTALQMQATLKQLNEQWRARGLVELHVGAGINCGEAIVGNLGSTMKMEVTVIGDEVNLASRLEGITKPFHQEVIIGENVARLLDERFHVMPVASVTVKNKTKPTDIFTVLGAPGEPLDAALRAYQCAFTGAIQAYRERRFTEADRFFHDSLTAKPGDGLAQLYLEDCADLLAHPPGPEWNGVVVMKSK